MGFAVFSNVDQVPSIADVKVDAVYISFLDDLCCRLKFKTGSFSTPGILIFSKQIARRDGKDVCELERHATGGFALPFFILT